MRKKIRMCSRRIHAVTLADLCTIDGTSITRDAWLETRDPAPIRNLCGVGCKTDFLQATGVSGNVHCEPASLRNEAYNELKARGVKVVAAELMERSIECQELKSHLDDQTGENEGLWDKITPLEAQGIDKDQSTTDRQQELNDLKG